MTAKDSILYLKMLLDDGRAWFPKHSMLQYVLQQAQMKKLNDYYLAGDERALRPLYRTSPLLQNGSQVADVYGQGILFPRACRVWHDASAVTSQGWNATFIDQDMYFNYNVPVYDPASSFPRAAYYTIINKYEPNSKTYPSYLYFSGGANSVASINYVAMMNPFAYLPGLLDIPLAVPAEYHPEIISLAAELINDMDVGEIERGQPSFQNQRLTLEKAGGAND